MSHIYPNLSTRPANSSRQETADLVEILKCVRTKYLRNKTLYDSLREYSADSDIKSDLTTNVRNVLMEMDVKNCMGLQQPTPNTKLLQVGDTGSLSLSYCDEHEVLIHVQKKLIKSNKVLTEMLCKLESVNTFQCNFFNLCTEDKILINLKTRLNEQQKIYADNLLKRHDLLEGILSIRLNDTKNMADLKTEELDICGKLHKLQVEIINLKNRRDILNETPTSMVAYSELLKDIYLEQMECQQKIEELEELKEKYNLVSCKQFEDILKSYLKYKTDFERKEALIKELRPH